MRLGCPFGIKRIIPHGRVLSRPASQPEGTSKPVCYELGQLYQLDREHCLLVTGMREQGGDDLNVGNDAFVFAKLPDLVPEKAIPVNRVDPAYRLRSGDGVGVQAQYPVSGAFVPLGARREDGSPHPAAGTWFLISQGVTFLPDRSGAHPQGDCTFDIIQLRWDGEQLEMKKGQLPETLFGMTPTGMSVTNYCACGDDFLCAFTVAGHGHAVFTFAWDGTRWWPAGCGKPFFDLASWDPAVDKPEVLSRGETEPSLRRCGDVYYAYTRGWDPKGRLYRSKDGLAFELARTYDWPVNGASRLPTLRTPQVLNVGLDGTLYLATNPSTGWPRNPLLAYPMVNGGLAEPLVIHDHQGIRDDHGPEAPICDHAFAENVWLEGRWRHFCFYRLCDLIYLLKKDREKGAQPTSWTGVYLAEMEYGAMPDAPLFCNADDQGHT